MLEPPPLITLCPKAINIYGHTHNVDCRTVENYYGSPFTNQELEFKIARISDIIDFMDLIPNQ